MAFWVKQVRCSEPKKNLYENVARENLRRAAKVGKGVMFWNSEDGDAKKSMHAFERRASQLSSAGSSARTAGALCWLSCYQQLVERRRMSP